MDYILLSLPLCLFALLGFFQFAKIIILKLFIHGKLPPCILVLAMDGDKDDAEFIIRSIAERIRWKKDLPYSEVVVADGGIGEKTTRILAALCDEYEFLKVVPAEKLASHITGHTEASAVSQN